MTTERLYYLCRVEANRNDLLTEQWERELYAAAIYNAKMWGYKIDAQQKEGRNNNSLCRKYNK